MSTGASSRWLQSWRVSVLVRAFLALFIAGAEGGSFSAEQASHYEFRANHDPNGIGKFYLGREIAHVMGHEGSDWLERPERVEEEKPDKLIELLGLKPGQAVADIGAGTGYISSRLAKKVSPGGKVYAVDIQQEMLDQLAVKMKASGITNVLPILGAIADPKLPPNSIDLVVMVDVYHEFSEPYDMMQNIVRALKPGGRVAFVEYRAEDPAVPIKRVHKMSEAQVKKEAAAAGLPWEKTIEDLPRQHVIIVRKEK
ncbi:MAG TPA: class I SAM-dependent methyltransferase [Verrucomicrobiae bacterium]|nr:class I SAM-dependent methyltransferase [Verrucomicrobiae bacterium]